MIHRLVKPLDHSFFLFGARGTGKSTLLRYLFPNQERLLWIDLLDPEQEDRFSRNPGDLGQRLDAAEGKIEWVILDEIQKVPKLLGVVHSRMETSATRFAMTGSSARMLKRESTFPAHAARARGGFRSQFSPALRHPAGIAEIDGRGGESCLSESVRTDVSQGGNLG